MSKQLENLLRTKLETKTEPSFDQDFMAKMNAEFEKDFAGEKTSWFEFGFNIQTVAAFACLVLVVFTGMRMNKEDMPNGEMVKVAMMGDMLKDMDMLAEMDQDMMNLSDEEWDILLSEES